MWELAAQVTIRDRFRVDDGQPGSNSQVLVNAVIVQMKSGQIPMSGYRTYRDLTPRAQLTEDEPWDPSQCWELGGKLLMRNLHLLPLAFFIFANAAFGQHGTAENGYYPPAFQGETWTGVVVTASEQTGEITLSCTKGGKSQTFVGVPEADYLVHEHSGATRPLKTSDIPVGKIITVWYIEETQKVGGGKVKVNTIFLIDAIANAKKSRVYFKAFR